MKAEYTPERILTIPEYRLLLAKILEHQKENTGITRSQLIEMLINKEVTILNPPMVKMLTSFYEQNKVTKQQYIDGKQFSSPGFSTEVSLIKHLVKLKKLKMVKSEPPGGRKGSYIVLTDYGMMVFLKYQIGFWVNNFLNDPRELRELNLNLMKYISERYLSLKNKKGN